MPVIQLKAELSFDQLVSAVKQLSEAERERLLSHVGTVRPPHGDHRLSATESELLLKINQGVPEALQNRYEDLMAKRADGALTNEEYTELLRLTDQLEMMDAQRLEYLAELAELQGKSLVVLMDELGIKPPPVL